MSEQRTGMKQVELTEEERNERARKQAAEQVSLDNLYAMKESHNREWNEQIKQHEKLISQLAAEAETGKAWVPAQTNMFDGPPENDGGDDPDTEASSDDEDPAPARRRKRGRRGNGASAGAAA